MKRWLRASFENRIAVGSCGMCGFLGDSGILMGFDMSFWFRSFASTSFFLQFLFAVGCGRAQGRSRPGQKELAPGAVNAGTSGANSSHRTLHPQPSFSADEVHASLLFVQ